MADEVRTDWWTAREAGRGRDATPALQGPRCVGRGAARGPLPDGLTTGVGTSDERPTGPDGAAEPRRPARRAPARAAAAAAPANRAEPRAPLGRRPRRSRRSASSLAVVERLEGHRGRPRTWTGPPEQQVGQGHVAGQDRSVEIGADHPVWTRPLGPVSPSPLPTPRTTRASGQRRPGRWWCSHRGSRIRSGVGGSGPAETGASGVTSANSSPTARRSVALGGGHIQDAQAVVRPAVGVGKGPAEQLEAGADTEHDRALATPVRRPASAIRAPGRPDLGAVPLPRRCSRGRPSGGDAPNRPG